MNRDNPELDSIDIFLTVLTPEERKMHRKLASLHNDLTELLGLMWEAQFPLLRVSSRYGEMELRITVIEEV